MLAGALKKKLRQGEITVGTWMTFDFWPGWLEVYKQIGLDCAILDMEHGAATLADAENLCRTARLLDFPLILRAEASVYHLLRKYMDMGPAGMMIPWVERVEQVETLRDAIFCAPQGRRGPGGVSIFGAPGLDRAGWGAIEENFCVMLQVETPAGVEAMSTIMAQDWVDCICLGPYDLSLNLNHCFEMQHPVVVEAITKVVQQGRAMGKAVGMPVGDMEATRFWLERGCTFFPYGDMLSMTRVGYAAVLKALR
jgi:2-keto-3-deoxy-L-rhamnonate aldolase RhmA